MSCGACAERMRRWILPEAEYVLEGDVWTGPQGEPISDVEVGKHHTRLMAERSELRAAAARLAIRAAREETHAARKQAVAFMARLRGE